MGGKGEVLFIGGGNKGYLVEVESGDLGVMLRGEGIDRG